MSYPNSNIYLDLAKEIIVLPDRENLKPSANPEYYLNRLNELETPSDRLKTFFWSIVNIRAEPTHEALMVRSISFIGASVGFFISGFLKNVGAHQEYRRKHNATIFAGRRAGTRHFWDTLVYGVLTKGMRTGTQTFFAMGAVSTLTFGSIVYRNRLHAPDFLVGCSILGGLSRLWLGSRAMARGAVLGFIAGSLFYGYGRFFEFATGHTVTQFRLINHEQWLRKEELRYRRLHADKNYVMSEMTKRLV